MFDLNPLEFQTLCRLVVGAVLVFVLLVALGTAGGAGDREKTTREVLRNIRRPDWIVGRKAPDAGQVFVFGDPVPLTAESRCRPCGVCGRPMREGEAVACAECWEGCEVEATRDDEEGEK